MKRHIWDGTPKHKSVDSSSQSCKHCGIIRQFVKGIPTYYDHSSDVLSDRYAPPCTPGKLTERLEKGQIDERPSKLLS